MPDTILLASLEPVHLDQAHALTQALGWPHRREDWAMALSLGQGIAALGEDGSLAGTAMVTPFGETATISAVIVEASLRGRGLGRRLMRAALALCGDRAVRLIATRDGLPLYETLGFRATHEIRQHQGPLLLPDAPVPDAGLGWATPVDLAAFVPGGAAAFAAPDEAAAFAAMDAAALGMDRRPLLDWLWRNARLAVLRDPADGRILGFGALRAFGRGQVAGPVIAGSAAQARAILGFLFAAAGAGSYLRVDVPAASGLAPWLEAHGLAHAGGGTAMTRGSGAQATEGPAQVFTLSSQAMG
jgi:GNAT superfamily N-acetyltransferase